MEATAIASYNLTRLSVDVTARNFIRCAIKTDFLDNYHVSVKSTDGTLDTANTLDMILYRN
jgi:hypothetical protein